MSKIFHIQDIWTIIYKDCGKYLYINVDVYVYVPQKGIKQGGVNDSVYCFMNVSLSQSWPPFIHQV